MKSLTLAILLATLSPVLAQAASTSSNGDGYRRVGHAVWHKTQNVNASSIINQPIPYGSASVFFLRTLDNDGLQTSANIAINDRFQVSLQPGNYSQVYSCTGVNQISGEITGTKTNDLLKNYTTFKLEQGVHYFFEVDVDNRGATYVKHITQGRAEQLLSGMKYQTHQITRVVPNCPVITPEPTRIPLPPPVMPQRVNLEDIHLKVLFDNDKHEVKAQYYGEIENVARFMQRHPEVTTTIEGHTDSNADDLYNVQLSQRRVDAVKQILIERYGISADRVNSIGYGESRPIATNKTAEGRQQNRRVVAVFQAN